MADWKQLCQEMLTFLEWYIENDDTIEGDNTADGGVNWDDENAYWIEGRNRAIQFVEFIKPLLENQELEATVDQYAIEYNRALAEASSIQSLPNDLDADQWQSLLIGSLQLLLNTANPAPDLAYAKWLVDQWYLNHTKSNA